MNYDVDWDSDLIAYRNQGRRKLQNTKCFSCGVKITTQNVQAMSQRVETSLNGPVKTEDVELEIASSMIENGKCHNMFFHVLFLTETTHAFTSSTIQ